MRVIAFASGKGGTGKTTTITNIALSLQKLGYKTLLIDANFTTPDIATYLGISPDISLKDVLIQDLDLLEALHEHKSGLHFIPGKAPKQRELLKLQEAYKRLKKKIKKLDYDFVLLDSPASLAEDTQAVLDAANEVIIVSNPEWPSIINAVALRDHAKELKKQVTGLILNRALVHEYEIPQELIERFTMIDLLGIIPENIEIRKSWGIQCPITICYPKSKAAKKYREIAAKIAGLELKESFWTKLLSWIFG